MGKERTQFGTSQVEQVIATLEASDAAVAAALDALESQVVVASAESLRELQELALLHVRDTSQLAVCLMSHVQLAELRALKAARS